MLKQASIFLLALLTINSVATAKDTKNKGTTPIFENRVPQREKPVIEKPEFEKRPREVSSIERPVFDRRQKEKSSLEKPVYVVNPTEKAVWDRSVFETKWPEADKTELQRFPQEIRDKKPLRRHHRVYRGGRLNPR